VTIAAVRGGVLQSLFLQASDVSASHLIGTSLRTTPLGEFRMKGRTIDITGAISEQSNDKDLTQ
jgi:hypothetical protein